MLSEIMISSISYDKVGLSINYLTIRTFDEMFVIMIIISLLEGLSAEEEEVLEEKLRYCYSVLGQEIQLIQNQWKRIKVGDLDSPIRSCTSDEGIFRFASLVLISCGILN